MAALPVQSKDKRGSMRDTGNQVKTAAQLARLRWRCRRGMRELDQLLERWLGQRWEAASEAECGVFLRLVDSEDDRLWAWFMGHEVPEDAELAALIHTIGQLPP